MLKCIYIDIEIHSKIYFKDFIKFKIIEIFYDMKKISLLDTISAL